MTAAAAALEPLRTTLVHDSEMATLGLRAMLAPYGVRVKPWGPNRASDVDITLYDGAVAPPAARAQMERHLVESSACFVYLTWDMTYGVASFASQRAARGCLSKSLPAAELAAGLRRIGAGEAVVLGHDPRVVEAARAVGLTPREEEVIGLIAAGLSNDEIARSAGLSINSIKSYIRSAYRKIEVRTRAQAVVWALRHGCVAKPFESHQPAPRRALRVAQLVSS